ncbi:glycoside hydrolase domain-containing protein [Aquibacillus saliphilus]|uniref:glycoside hydrolase domain-containing protein n=1 Tax=Aquibacillus saliphilus TaxID=1909422 RepID=UPI001CF05639|nr:glycoside hydrolase domain-containing protein [Aquibacillus saliphilus]
MSYLWGVKSASTVTKQLYDCVLKNYGKPNYWGRYLTTVEGAAEGMTQKEIELLHNSGTKVLSIHNNFTSATGNRQGRVTAQNASFHAKRLGIPEGKILFAYVENFFEIDSAWIRGYVEAMFPTGYKPGFYNNSDEGGFRAAYCQAVTENQQVANQAVLWSAEPKPGISKKRNAPNFNPSTPRCNANVWGWQYGQDASSCPIDTNLIDQRLFDMTW